LKQSILKVSVDGGENLEIVVPYTLGEWQLTEPIQLQLAGGQTLRFLRERPCFGLAIKKIILS
jgi:hypothetical protein